MKRLVTDVLVAGAGCSGICAAIAAARHGARVLLLNDRSVPGGNASSEIGVGITGACHSDSIGVSLNPGIYMKETGIVDELRQRALFYNMGGGYGADALWDAVFFDAIYGEKNITLMLNTSVEACETKDGRIEKCFARNVNSNDAYEIYAHVYIDATGHATLADCAGADYTQGREAKSVYGEKWAPDTADRYTMGNTFLFQTEDAGHEVEYHAPDFAYDIGKLGLLEQEGFTNPKCFRALSTRGADWTYEYGGQLDTVHDTENIDLELRKLTFGIWDYVKNSGKYPDAKNRRLVRIYTRAGTRESRRVLGDYVLTENDVENKVRFPDAVGHGGWPMDVHANLGIYDKEPASNFIPVTGPYPIPYRTLYSRNVHNLMMAGRDISVSHIALGSTRVMATCSVIGQAVGTAAALCVRDGVDPREIGDRMPELQREIVDDDQTIYFLREDDMSAFTAEATSERTFSYEKETSRIRLDRHYALALMTETDRVDSYAVKVHNESTEEVLLRYRVFTGAYPETFLLSQLLGEREITLPGDFDGWITLPINAAPGADKKLYTVFLPCPSVTVACGKDRCPGAITMLLYTAADDAGKNHDSVPLEEEKTGFIGFDHYRYHFDNILFRDILPAQKLFSADKAINGYSRPCGGMNLWMPEGALPQTLTLRAEAPVRGKRVEILFDNALEYDHFRTMPPCLAKRFTLTVITDRGELVFHENACWKRRNVFSFDEAEISELRLCVEETYGDVPGVYAVKLF